jgi:hypothetical protein
MGKGKQLIILLLVFLLLSACSFLARMDAGVREKAEAIRILKKEEVSGRQYRSLGEVSGRSCYIPGEYFASVREAQEQMKVEAARAGAGALINVTCENTLSQWQSGCRSIIECRGEAIGWR